MNKYNRKLIYDGKHSANCFFRSALNPPELKVMLQITERCNMHCKHCFLSATKRGHDLQLFDFKNNMLNKLVDSNVKKITLTGGEPLLNPSIIEIIECLNSADIEMCICTNASLLTDTFLERVHAFNVHFNVSLDGINYDSYGRFREIGESGIDLKQIYRNINMVGRYNMLNGILTTPNSLISQKEYTQLLDFAVCSGAKYLLLNPLSPFGRGKNVDELLLNSQQMHDIQTTMIDYKERVYSANPFELVFIRFPSEEAIPSSPCAAGLIPYIFVNGDVAICPYIVFAAENSDNIYNRSDFIIGNMFHDSFILSQELEDYMKNHLFCERGCQENMGCAAMKIAKNQQLYDFDEI